MTLIKITDDAQNSEKFENLKDAIEGIKSWFDYTDLDLSSLESIQEPESLKGLQAFAHLVGDKVAELEGAESFHGHGNYSVSARCQASKSLTVEIVSEDSPVPEEEVHAFYLRSDLMQKMGREATREEADRLEALLEREGFDPRETAEIPERKWLQMLEEAVNGAHTASGPVVYQGNRYHVGYQGDQPVLWGEEVGALEGAVCIDALTFGQCGWDDPSEALEVFRSALR